MFDKYLQYVKKPLLYCFFTFAHALLRIELGRHDKRGGSQDCPNCGACRESVDHVIF